MTQTISVNAIARESLIPREDCEWVEHAYLGEVGSGKLLIHDAAGTVVTTGHKTVIAVQDASTPTRLYTGYVGEKTIRRGEYTIGASRWVEVTLNDLNTLLARKVISGTDGKRSAETPSARLTWLLASNYLTGLVSDYGAVTKGTATTMDKNDYRGQKPGDVLAAIAKHEQFNYYVRWHAGSAAPELVFRDDNAGTADASTLRISNVAADVDSTVTFAPIDAALVSNPDDVYSGAYAAYSSSAVYETYAATGTAFVPRDGVTDDAGLKNATSASAAAEDFLLQSASEEHTLSLTIRVKAAQVNLVRAGDRIQVKLSHLATEGYGSFTWFRVLRKRTTQPLNTDNDYDIALDLSPQETAPVPASCSSLYANTPSATYYPLGGSGNTPNLSDGVVYYFRSGYANPVPGVPTAGWLGSWHFPAYSAGGLGNIDYAGDCSQNWLILMTVGNGTWTIQTETYAGQGRTLDVWVGPTYPGTYRESIASGASVAVTINDTGPNDCFRVVAIKDAGTVCGAKWGWSQAVWVAA